MKTFLSIILLVFVTTSFAQEEENKSTKIGIDPTYPGGDSAMFAFINNNFEYPIKAKEKGEEGIILVRFVIRSNGNIEDVEILKSVSKSLDAEAIRVIKLMPKWKPGEQDGEPVNVRYVLPIKATIENGKTKRKKRKWFKRNR